MKSVTRKFALVRVVVVAACSLLLGSLLAHAQTDPLPSWNDGPAKQSIILNDNNAGKPEGIHFMIGRRPYAAFGNSTGDRQMLEYTGAGDGARLMMLVLHDDANREYAYGPA